MREVSRIERLVAVVQFVACVFASFDTRADTVVAGGATIENVDVQTIRAGRVFYLDVDGNLLQAPIEAVESLHFEGLLELDEAQRAMKREEWEEALPDLLVAMSKAEGDAQGLWVHAKLAQAHNALGDAIEAAGHTAAVLEIDPAPVWLSLRPSGPMDNPSFYAVGEADYFLKRARRKATDQNVIDAMDALIAELAPHVQQMAQDDPRRYRAGSTISGILLRDIGKPLSRREGTDDPDDLAADAGSEMDAPRPPSPTNQGPESPGAIEGLLERNEFRAALVISEQVAADPGERDLAEFLYQYGRALAGSDRPADATIYFMRCAIEFPTSRHVPRSLIETAIIYRNTYDKPDTAERLLLIAGQRAEEAGDTATAERARELLVGQPSGQ